MDIAWLLLYNLFVIPVFWLGLRAASLFNDKVRRGLQGRRRLFSSLHAKLALRGKRSTFWVHVASMGEFEQAKPILERIKARTPDVFVIVTFFSPSGFDHSQDYSYADAVAYLPFDSYGAATRFISIVRPNAALFIRYELWLNHLHAIRRARVPLYLACTSALSYTRAHAVVRSYLAAAYRLFDRIYCNDESDRAVFAAILGDPVRCEVTGDTRFDRVLERAAASRSNPSLSDAITAQKFVLVAGSTWSGDEEILFPAIDAMLRKRGDEFLCILAPHEPTVDECVRLEARFSCCRLSRIDRYAGEPVILVDSVGRLFPLYQYATVAYVGGGFGTGVHSVLEPAAFGVKVLFGPHVERAAEAQDLAHTSGGEIVTTVDTLLNALLSASDHPDQAAMAGRAAAEFVTMRAGASDRILDHIAAWGIVK